MRENADGAWNLPAPATFVIDRDGTIVAGEARQTLQSAWSPPPSAPPYAPSAEIGAGPRRRSPSLRAHS